MKQLFAMNNVNSFYVELWKVTIAAQLSQPMRWEKSTTLSSVKPQLLDNFLGTKCEKNILPTQPDL